MKVKTHSNTLLLIISMIVLMSSFPNIEAKDTDPTIPPNKDQNDLFCAILNPLTGTYIDLSQLSLTPNEDNRKHQNKRQESSKTRWLVKGWGEDLNKNFTISVCSSPVSTDEELSTLTNHTGAFYTESEDKKKLVSIGDFGVKPELFGSNSRKLTLKYGNGSVCPNGVDTRSTLLNFICDRDIATKAQISYIGSLHDCSYFFEVRSIHACPTSNKKNEINVMGMFFGIFAVFFLVEYGRRWLQRRIVSNNGVSANSFGGSNSDSSSNIFNHQFMGDGVINSRLRPNWEFFENQSFPKRAFKKVSYIIRRLVSPIINLTRGGSHNHGYPVASGRSTTRPIGLYSSSFSSSNSQTSFIRDMEIQNNIMDNLEVNSETSNHIAYSDNSPTTNPDPIA